METCQVLVTLKELVGLGRDTTAVLRSVEFTAVRHHPSPHLKISSIAANKDIKTFDEKEKEKLGLN